MRDLYSNDVETAARLARDDAEPPDRPSFADLWDGDEFGPCTCYVDPISGLQPCAACEGRAEAEAEALAWLEELPEAHADA